jgi:phosphoglycolate phosphatase
MKYKAIIFDFDYTLADATEGIVQSYNYAFAQLGLPLQSKETICKTVGMTIVNSFKHMDNSLDDEAILILRSQFKKCADEVMLDGTKLFEQTQPLLHKLKVQGIKTGVVSSKFRFRIEDVFKRDNVMQHIDVIIGIEDVEKAKPEPDGLFCAIKSLGTYKNEVLYVGDSIIDGETAKAAKVDFAAVLTGTTFKEEFSDIPCKVIVSDLSELYDFLVKDK